MAQKNEMEMNSLDLLGFLWKNRKSILIIGFIAAVVSSFVALVIEEKFESTVTLYPSKTSSVSFGEINNEDQTVSKFGEEEEAEQMLQILESAKIREEIITKFDLLNHYEIDTTGKYIFTELNETYADNISFTRNKNGAVLITVLDKSPDTAALIANEIADLFDRTKNAMIHARAITDFNIKKEKLKKLESEMQSLRDTMSVLSSLGVVTADAYQGLTDAMLKAGDLKTKNEYKQKLAMTEKFGSLLKAFQIETEFLSERISTLKSSYEQAETDANSFPSHKFTVEEASPAEKKSYPVRWLIVVITSLSSVLFTCIVLLFNEKIKELKL
ncbi:MAG: Wzz/FepE/Etk N-terminal domain-containing protein [Bacteroidota bacterium]|nr:Wzz/FepE/Etk N-terminal domain-containing protein [Bacteroidota bacterium]MEC8967939.1 Wzz/FepE/Etk N-terminal domain-containing protein [Bacteroidota bacterium]